jgi:asparagine N-glycosylation enzyme membrane subunit Stt3
MMTGLDGMMGSMMAWMLGFSVLTWLLVLVILALVAVWLFQQVRHGGTG